MARLSRERRPTPQGVVEVVLSRLLNPSKSPFTKGDFLFPFAEYFGEFRKDTPELGSEELPSPL
jgi:hypothetical protein